jgi:hypothetical protein
MKVFAAAALAVLLLVAAIGGSYGLTEYAIRQSQAGQQRAGQIIEHKLCTIFGGIAALKPPAGNPAANPARGFDQQLHVKLAEVGPALECPR